MKADSFSDFNVNQKKRETIQGQQDLIKYTTDEYPPFIKDNGCSNQALQIEQQSNPKKGRNKIITNIFSKLSSIKYLRNLISVILLVYATFQYTNMNQLCPFQTDGQCVNQYYRPRVRFYLTNSIASASIYVFVFYMALWRKISRIFILFEIVIFIYYILLQDHVVSSRNIKGFIQLAQIVFLLLIVLVINIIKCLFNSYKRYRLKFIITLILIITLVSIYSSFQFKQSCINWNKGINIQIIQTQPYCKIQEPQICWYDIMNGYMDATKYVHDCTKDTSSDKRRKNEIQIFQKYIRYPEGTNYVELPRTEYFSEVERSQTYEDSTQIFFDKLKFHKKKSDISERAEIYLDLQQLKYKFNIKLNKQKIKFKSINIKQNISLVKQRESRFNKVQSNTNHTLPQNIIILYVDATSRARFIQKMPKSTQWFEKQAQNPNSNHTFFQALRYMSVSPFTFHNYLAFEYGVVSNPSNSKLTASYSQSEGYMNQDKTISQKNSEIQQDQKWNSTTKFLQDSGYIVGKARTQCGSSIMEHDQTFKEFLQMNPPDHELYGIMCDPNFQDPENKFGMMSGPYSIMRKCLYEKEINSYVFDYGKQFLQTYKNQPKYLELQFLDSHEGTGEAINYFDSPVHNFLNFLSLDNYLKDSIVLMVSDHGLHMQGLYYLLNVDIYKIEVALPGLFLLADNSLLTQKQRDDLIDNQQKVLTFFEVHYMLKFLITKDGNDQDFYLDNSLLSSTIDPTRDCNDIPLISEAFCVCKKQE